MPFSDEVKTKVLLWADRHCCLCKKACGPNIEVHHIVLNPKTDDIDNAIPLCFDCHGIIGSYNLKHPKGNRFKLEELKARREQVYEEFTRHLVPKIFYMLTDINPPNPPVYPKVLFLISHLGDSLPVTIKTMLGIVNESGIDYCVGGHYSGEKLWHLNPGFSMQGNFTIPDKYKNESRVAIEIKVTIFDQYERPHEHLPIRYIHDQTEGWFLEP